jgi:hypothetical protein
MKTTRVLMLIVLISLAAGIPRIHADSDQKQDSRGGSYFWCPWCDERQGYKNPNNVDNTPQDYQNRYDMDVKKKSPEVRHEITMDKARFMMESYVFGLENPDLKLGKIIDKGDVFDAEVLGRDGSLFEMVKIDKQTGEIKRQQK